jgi:predicted permease
LIESAKLDPGFDIRHTAWAQMRLVPESYPGAAKVRAMATSTLEKLRSVPGVRSATVVTFVPLNDHFAYRASVVYSDMLSEGRRIEYSWNTVGPDYFSTMGIDVVTGREFNLLDREGSQRVIILNESMAHRAFGASNPVGRRIRLGRDERTIIAVVRNSKYSSIGEYDRPAVYESYLQSGGRALVNYLVRTDRPPEATLTSLNAALLAADPAAAVEVKPMSRALGFALLPSRAGATLLGVIGLLGLALASVGLYGVLAYSVSRRTREIGLRVALGAPRGSVLQLLARESGWILASGILAGTLVAVFITRPLAMFLVPGLKPVDPLTYAAVAGVLIIVGCTASITPTLRALRIDPMTALRYE